eukprot:gene11507-11603_t
MAQTTWPSLARDRALQQCVQRTALRDRGSCRSHQLTGGTVPPDAMAMLKAQRAITPPPQWVRVTGGFTEHQFVEKRLPTLEELNAAALLLCGYTRDTPDPPSAMIARDAAGNSTGLLLAKPNATILYATLAKGPKLPPKYQRNATRHLLSQSAWCEYQNYPDDYVPKHEREDILRWTSEAKYQQGDDYFRLDGAGEMLTFSAADFEDFRGARPELASSMEDDLEGGRDLGAEPLALATISRVLWRVFAGGGGVSGGARLDGCRASACGVHGHAHVWGRRDAPPVSDEKVFWGALGFACWAF